MRSHNWWEVIIDEKSSLMRSHQTGDNPLQASKFQIECTCPLGKWIVKITCPNVPFTWSEIYKANATYVKIRNTQSSIGHVLQVFHLSDCHFYSSQTIGRVKFQTLHYLNQWWCSSVMHIYGTRGRWANSMVPRWWVYNLKRVIFKLILRIDIWCNPPQFHWGECQRPFSLINQHWCRYCFGAIS